MKSKRHSARRERRLGRGVALVGGTGILALAIAAPAAATGELAGQKPAETTAPAQATKADAAREDAAPRVARAVVTHGIEDREPIDDIRSVGTDTELLYFFTDLRNLQQSNVIHRWLRGDVVMGEVAFHVGGPRWRVWSTKNLEPTWTGAWAVEVVDADGAVLERRDFSFITIAKPETAEKPAAAPAP